ncbi:hypothetical protein [Rickettsiales endosymbiont of Stachyamoeba lipophora]|uniref:hypothetical protein n=1 Tax=Rickettsiales endosymbiont of Stachyamoeba lipophora TaxID=2486578 RepID=UPI000F652BDF|nr:hypothetical protein [Rickettsiales endosymbiont of Stachyamoeba lipophora]
MDTGSLSSFQRNIVSPTNRRLDFITRLIQGDEVCGTVCFNGDNLLLYTNKSGPSKLVDDAVIYLNQ